MPDNIKDSLRIPVEVPVWSLICAIVGGAFAFGILYSELKTVVKGQERVDLIFAQQIKNTEIIARHEIILTNHEQRITTLEKAK
jgi:hypothetical protein